MSALTRSRTNEPATRIQDYLDDKFQTTADLENVNGLLARVQEQQELLQKQLIDARKSLSSAEVSTQEYSQALRTRALAFQRQQADIDNRLTIITESEVSDNAVKKFESRMNKVKRLEIAIGYVEVLREVETLINESRKNLTSKPRTSLASYSRLRSILIKLQAAQPAADGGAPHLVDQVERHTGQLESELKHNLESALQKTLDRMAWPKKELKVIGNIVEEWRTNVMFLLDLQEPDMSLRNIDQSTALSEEPVSLLPLDVMAQPLALRFRFHFYGERPTNRLDKPEYFFSHVLDLLEQHGGFMTDYLQPILDERVRANEHLETVYTDAVSAFITSLLPMLQAKCLSILPQLIKQPQLMSHMIHEMMSFDTTLRDSWTYAPVPGLSSEWKGLTWEILTKQGYFNTWLEAEKNFALSRYKSIRDSSDSNTIDYDGVEAGRTKPTKGAIRVNDLLETVTDKYRRLSSFSQKMKFLMEVQLFIFDDYHHHLHDALQAYLVSSHTAGRLIQGQTETDAIGLKGLENLAKIFGSAEYLERKMSDWSDDVFFLELWDELQDRAQQNSGRKGSLGRDLHMDEVAAKTSSTIKANDDNQDREEGGLFDETALSYRRLRERSEAEIVRALEINIRGTIRPFTRVSIWSSISTTVTDPNLLSPSSALDSLLQSLTTLVDFLSRTLAAAPLRRVSKQMCLTIQREVYDNVILKNTFSAAGAAQLKRDLTAIEDTINASLKATDESQRNMRKLEDAVTLLNLPIRASGAARDDQGEADGWNFDAEDEDPADLENTNSWETSTWGLWQAEKALFASNESARSALSSLQVEHLNESDARNIIKRRLEINS